MQDGFVACKELIDDWRPAKQTEGEVTMRCTLTTLEMILDQVGTEVARAEGLHAPLNSHHEAYAVILEELDEYWDEVRKKASKRDLKAMRTELIQTAAMCVRAILNVCDGEVING
jgi:hypothetical protein